jgi:hypothetical protein
MHDAAASGGPHLYRDVPQPLQEVQRGARRLLLLPCRDLGVRLLGLDLGSCVGVYDVTPPRQVGKHDGVGAEHGARQQHPPRQPPADTAAVGLLPVHSELDCRATRQQPRCAAGGGCMGLVMRGPPGARRRMHAAAQRGPAGSATHKLEADMLAAPAAATRTAKGHLHAPADAIPRVWPCCGGRPRARAPPAAALGLKQAPLWTATLRPGESAAPNGGALEGMEAAIPAAWVCARCWQQAAKLCGCAVCVQESLQL